MNWSVVHDDNDPELGPLSGHPIDAADDNLLCMVAGLW